ncbi:MAG: co-chaperone GroES [Phycisphaerales bacterium]|nr:co-chaperone GroES [Phycisphaerales bacterium]
MKPTLKTRLRPIGDKVLIQRDEAETETAGGIVLPDEAKQKPTRGRVLSAGPGRLMNGKLVPMQVKPGDDVIFAIYGGDEHKIEGESVFLIDEPDILCIV